MTGKVLYVGGFELPDKNAAAQRVIANAKSLRAMGYEVELIGISHDLAKTTPLHSTRANFENFTYYSTPYPKHFKDWISYLCCNSFEPYINSFKPQYIIAYNYPAIALERLRSYCVRNHIKIIADVTEWYAPTGSFLHKILKGIDTELRMRIIHKKLDGIIAISRFLADYYNSSNTVTIPPTVDLSMSKWNRDRKIIRNTRLEIVYAGSPGNGHKDRLDIIIDALQKIKRANVHLTVIGVTDKEYIQLYHKKLPCNVKFCGRLKHTEVLQIIQKADFQFFVRPVNKVTTAGFPTKFVESISCGTPVITNRTSNISDYLIEGKSGMWIDIDNLNLLINQLNQLTSDEILAMKKYCLNVKDFDYHSYIPALRQLMVRTSNKLK